MSVVLIVEDEPLLRTSVARGLAKLEGVEVLTAGTLEDAVRALDVKPKLVVSDLDLPDGSGIELLPELERRRLQVPVLFVSAYVGTFRSRIPRDSNIEVYEKPISIERLRQLVTSRLEAEPQEHDYAPFSLDEYLQLAAMGRHSVVLRAEIASMRVGEIVVWQGEVRSAVDALGSGPEAFRRLATATIGRPDAHLAARALRAEPTLHDMANLSWQNLLFDAIRVLDERRARGEEEVPPMEMRGPSPVETARRPGGTFEEHFEAGIEALLAKRHADAYRAFEAAHALRPDEPKVVANLQRLRELGHG